jgi:hypothetical protein
VDQGQFVLARLLEQQMLETSTSVVNTLSLNLDDALFYVVRKNAILYGCECTTAIWVKTG